MSSAYSGGASGPDGPTVRQRPRRFAPSLPVVALVVLLAAGTLAGAYTLGRGLGGADPAADPRGLGGHGGGPVPTSRRADPEIPASPQLTAEPGGPFGARMTTGTGDVALTFDDGPDPRYTPQVLALLRRYRVRATFCLVGGSAQRHPELVRAIAADGHTLCNHSWSHDLKLGRRTPDQIRADLVATTRAIQAAVPGRPVRYFRTPGGNWTADVVAVAERLGMTPLHWDVDPRDWSLPGVGTVVASVTGGTAAGSVVLMHDGGGDRQPSVNALKVILPDLTRRFTLTALPTGDPVVQAGPVPAPTGAR